MDLFSPLAFATGMVALINPCGFALLPAYLGMFLGNKDEKQSRIVSLNRAQGVGLALTLGILVVFLAVGIVFGGVQSWFASYLPYFNIVLGIALVVLGIAMLFGYELKLKVPKLNKGGKSGSFSSMFLFGVSYAIASLSCTIGLFISAAGLSSASSSTFGESLGGFISYGLGMGLLATVLTLLMALGKRGLVNKFRSVLPKINFISAILLLLVGPYMVGYGIWEIQVLEGHDLWEWLDNIITGGTRFQSSMTTWFQQSHSIFGRDWTRSAILGLPFVAINVALILAGFAARRANRVHSDMDRLSRL